ncbi:MAG: GNAT family N-acetyltransferase [Betaproteobacteria bacterium]|nr:GNAT family N-acetyltransferase [Betaproteobacteria bacterium]
MPEVMTLTKSLTASDRGAITAHFLALGAQDRRLRFGTPISDAAIRDYVARIDFDRDAAFGVFANNLSLRGVAHVAVSEGVAELGVSVLQGHRRRGIGSALFERAAGFARNRFIRTLFMYCLTENTAMMRIARKSGMTIVTGGGEASAHLELAPLDAATIAAEFLQERVALFDYNLKAQVLTAFRLQRAASGTAKPG